MTASPESQTVRLVVFTVDPNLQLTPWWRVLLEAGNISAILICRQIRSRRPKDVFRRFRRNLQKHGLIFVPYRAFILARDLIRRPTGEPTSSSAAVDVLEAERIHSPEVVRRVQEWKPDLGLSLGAPILRADLFGIPARGTINLHLGKIPEYRGAPPGFWELWTGAASVGATVHWVDAGLDTGPVIAAAEAPIYPNDTLRRLQARLEELGVHVFREGLRRAILNKGSAGVPQPAAGRTFRIPTVSERLRLYLRISGRRARLRLGSGRFVMKSLVGSVLLGVARPLRDTYRWAMGRHPVRIYTFHRVSHLCRDGMTVTPESFCRQVSYLLRFNHIVPLDDALRLLAGGARLRRPVAAITFDDGYRSARQPAALILRDLGVRSVTCFLSTDLIGTDRRFPHDADNPVAGFLGVLSWEDVRALQAEGWNFGGHTATHARLSACAPSVLERELVAPLKALQRELGIAAPTMSYPFGAPTDISEDALTQIRRVGYRACFSDFGGENWPGTDPFRMVRIDLGGDHDTIGWKAIAQGFQLSRWGRYWPADPLKT